MSGRAVYIFRINVINEHSTFHDRMNVFYTVWTSPTKNDSNLLLSTNHIPCRLQNCANSDLRLQYILFIRSIQWEVSRVEWKVLSVESQLLLKSVTEALTLKSIKFGIFGVTRYRLRLSESVLLPHSWWYVESRNSWLYLQNFIYLPFLDQQCWYEGEAEIDKTQSKFYIFQMLVLFRIWFIRYLYVFYVTFEFARACCERF